jgi:Spy/CpxP family protein refolding chaperone
MPKGIAPGGALSVMVFGSIVLSASGAFHGVGVLAVMAPGPTTEAWAQDGGQGSGHQEHHPAVQACQAEFEKVVGEGRGFGMAFAADQNGYPGPMHVLELKDRLKLSPDQEARVQALMTAMYGESRPKSARLLEAEARLRRLFADGAADEPTVRAAVQAVEQARSEVRLVHLLTHLHTREILTEEQRRIYHEARWGGR